MAKASALFYTFYRNSWLVQQRAQQSALNSCCAKGCSMSLTANY